MSQTNPLPETISNSSSLLSGLISQINGALSNNADNELFSSLLSQSTALQNALAAQTTPATSVAPSSNVSSSNAPSATTGINSSLDADAPTDTNTSSNTDSSFLQTSDDSRDMLIQKLKDLSRTLHKIMMLASNHVTQTRPHHGDAKTHTTNTTTQTNTSDTSTTNANAAMDAAGFLSGQTFGHGKKIQTVGWTTATQDSEPTTTDTDTTQGTQSTTDTTIDAQTLAEIIAELMAVVQIAIRNLQDNKPIDSDTLSTVSQVSKNNKLNALDELAANLTSAANTGENSESANIPALSSLLTGASGETITDSLLQLLKALQKDAQGLLPTESKTTETNSLSSSVVIPDIKPNTYAESPAITTTALTQFTELDGNLKLDGAVRQNIKQVQQTQQSSQEDTTNPTSTPETSASSSTSKTTNTTNPPSTQNQLFAPASQTPPADPSASTTAPLNVWSVAAAIGGREGAGTNDAGSDSLWNNHNSGSTTNNLDLGTGLTAEGLTAAGTYNFASTLSAIRATNGGSMGLPSVVDQVILQLNRGVKSGNDEMSVQLHPSDLGKITVKLNIDRDGKVQGTVTAENPKTLEMLQKDSRSLERALQDAGLRADPGSLQFDLSGQGGNSAGQTANGGQDQNNRRGDGTISATDTTGLVDIGALPETYYITPTGVNIRV